MKKYNTPELKISMFDTESVLTDSSAEAFKAFADAESTKSVEKKWDDLKITF